MMRRTDLGWEPLVIAYKNASAIPNGALSADDSALREIDEVLQIAERLGDDVGLGIVRMTMGLALLHRDSTDAGRGLQLLMQARDSCLHERFFMSVLPIIDVYTAQQRATGRDPDGAVSLMRAAVNELFDAGQLGWSIPATGVRDLPETDKCGNAATLRRSGKSMRRACEIRRSSHSNLRYIRCHRGLGLDLAHH